MAIQVQNITPDYRKIFRDILTEKFPEIKGKYDSILNKEQLVALDVIFLNNDIFSNSKYFKGGKYRSYKENDIIQILNFQLQFELTNTELAKRFNLSRNSVTKWKKLFSIINFNK